MYVRYTVLVQKERKGNKDIPLQWHIGRHDDGLFCVTTQMLLLVSTTNYWSGNKPNLSKCTAYKSIAVSKKKNIKDRIHFFVLGDESQWNMSCMVMLQSCVWKSAEKYNNKCISTVKHWGRVSLCGELLTAGIGKLLHWEKSFNTLELSRWLQNGLHPINEKLFSKEERSDVIFQQDNTPVQVAKTTKKWLENKFCHLSKSRFEPYSEYLVSH